MRRGPIDVSLPITNAAARYIDLSGLGWDAYLAGLGPAHRADFRRKLRRLGRDFRLSFRTVATEERRPQALHRLIALHRARWCGRGPSFAFHTPGHVRFHEEITRLACERGWLRIHTLWLDGAPAGMIRSPWSIAAPERI